MPKVEVMDARDIMTSPVVTAGPETTILEIVQLMLENRISAVPILDEGGKLIGLVSEGDLMRRSEIGTERPARWWLSAFRGAVSMAEAFVKTHGVKASEIMTRDVITAREDTPLWEIAETLEKNGIKRLPVIRDGVLVGIVSRANLLQALTAQRGQATEMASKDDRAIREELHAELQAERWSNTSHLNIVVKNGVVHFWGLINAESQREALKVAAENISGVKDVIDHTINAATLTRSD